MTYTPGPWYYRHDEERIIDAIGTWVADVIIPNKHNRPLITCAPELLGMLETCYGAIKSLDNDALGNVPDKSPTEQGWYIRDELLHNIAGIIRKAKAEGDSSG